MAGKSASMIHEPETQRSTLHQLHLVIREELEKVKNVRKNWNAIIRNFLSDEMRFKLNPGSQYEEKDAKIPVKVEAGINSLFMRRFEAELGKIDLETVNEVNQAIYLLERRNVIWALFTTDPIVAPHYAITVEAGKKYIKAQKDILTFLRNTLMAEADIGKNGQYIDGVLGTYDMVETEVTLLVAPLWITSIILKVPLEDLAIVVFCHELAHGYHHLGKDADRRHWENMHSSVNADRENQTYIVEGVAQYYTQKFVNKQQFYPGLKKAMAALLKFQSDPYTWYKNWEDSDRELVRAAIKKNSNSRFNTWSDFGKAVGAANPVNRV